MNDTEARKIIAVMMVAYPNYKPVNIDMTAAIWADMLSDFSYDQVNAALKAYILSDNGGFAPGIGQIVENIQEITTPHGLNEMEAWSLVRKALNNGYYGAEEEFANLPPVVQKSVGQPSNLREWAASDIKSVESVIQSNFIKTYRLELLKAQKVSKLPQDMQNAIEKANEGMGIEINACHSIEECEGEQKGVPMPENCKMKLIDIFGGG